MTRAVARALLPAKPKPTPQPKRDPRLVPCAGPDCETATAPERLFCFACTQRIRPELLQAIVDAYRQGLPEEEKRLRIARAIDSLRTKKPRR